MNSPRTNVQLAGSGSNCSHRLKRRQVCREQRQLSSISGDYRADQLGCDFVLSRDGKRVFHSGGLRGLFGTLVGMLEKQADRKRVRNLFGEK